MDSYNDNWCQCPICCKLYSKIHRPTTLKCGHSVCIDHINGENRLEKCPTCHCSLKSSNEYHISYALEEAVNIFNSLKNSNSWNTLTQTEKPKDVDSSGERHKKLVKKSQDFSHYDESYEKQLQAKERLLDEIYSTSNNHSHKSSRIKSSDHRSILTTTDEQFFRNSTYSPRKNH